MHQATDEGVNEIRCQICNDGPISALPMSANPITAEELISDLIREEDQRWGPMLISNGEADIDLSQIEDEATRKTVKITS